MLSVNTERHAWRRRRRQSFTYVVKAAQLVHQPVELEQVQVSVAKNWSFIDGSSCREQQVDR